MFNNTRCCAGLKQISNSWADGQALDYASACIAPTDGSFICSKCGDGICGKGENKCNCKEDCDNQSKECAKEGESLGAVVPGNTKQCCAGLTPQISENVVGTRGVCVKPCDKVCKFIGTHSEGWYDSCSSLNSNLNREQSLKTKTSFLLR